MGLHRFHRSSTFVSPAPLPIYPTLNPSPLCAFSAFNPPFPPRRLSGAQIAATRVSSLAHTMAHFSTWVPKLESARRERRLPIHFRRGQRADFLTSFPNGTLGSIQLKAP